LQLYDTTMAPNPRRVRIFLAEKGIEIPTVQISLADQEQRAPEYLAKNSLGKVPTLELDDGSFLSESVAICRYFEELHPDPLLMGTDAADRARVEMWQRRMEREVLDNIAAVFRMTHDFFKGRIRQVPAWGEACREQAMERLEWLDGLLADREFVAGDRFTIADITAMVGIDFGAVTKTSYLPEHKNIARWHADVSARPSAKA
jgi:glutathione S-transferase